jgi:hypothetical protein
MLKSPKSSVNDFGLVLEVTIKVEHEASTIN